MMTGLLAVSLRGAGEGNDSPLAFRAQDRWCAIGDSITHSGSYHEWIQLYWMTRFPTHSLELFNGGISGDTAEGGLRRFLWDILPNRPTVASVMFGMNDVARTLYSDAPPITSRISGPWSPPCNAMVRGSC
jgi:lysophospholipase L1-like esterase